MSTLHTLNLALTDIEDRLVRELQFSTDAERQIMACISVVKDGIEQLERSITGAFSERTRALSAAIGTGKPSPETLENGEPARKPKLVKAASASGDA